MDNAIGEVVGGGLLEGGSAASVLESIPAVVGATPAASGTGVTRFVAAVLVLAACLRVAAMRAEASHLRGQGRRPRTDDRFYPLVQTF